MKILYISQYFPPEMGAPAARVSELSRHWVEAGHEVTVLTGFPNHPDGVVRPEYRRRFRRGICREQWSGVNVVRTWLLPFPNRKPYERILNYSSFCASAAITGSFLSRPDVVIATSPQLLVGLSGCFVSRLKRVPFVLEVRDLWPESLAAAGVGGHTSTLYRGIDRLANFLYRAADHIAVVTPAFRENLIQVRNIPPSKISVVPNGVETQTFAPQLPDSELRSSLGAEGKFLVSYIGTLGLAHGLETLLESAERLQATSPEIVFLLLGEGADRERILTLAESKKLTNLRFVPQQPRERIPAYIAASDVCLVMLRDSAVFDTVIPTKMLEFMACAKPVILTARGQAKSVLESAGAGVAVPPADAGELCRAILRLQQQPALREQMGRTGRSYIVQNLSRRATAHHYLEVLGRILESNSEARITAAA